MTYHLIQELLKTGCGHVTDEFGVRSAICKKCAKEMLACAVEFTVKNTINVISKLPVEV